MALTGQAGAVTHYVWPGESIQAAIDDANNGDEIEVLPGTYYEAINFNGKSIRLYSSGGRDVTTIDANWTDHVVQCVSGEDANTILEGFTITGGKADGSSPDDFGGGMYNYQSSPTVTDCNFSGNLARYGGGMYNCYSNSSPMVTNCTFSANEAVTHGGGMFNNNSSPTVTDCNFIGNTTLLPLNGDGGGGMFNSESSPTVTNCTFSGNWAEVGGGMFNGNNSSPTVTDCNFSGNTTEGGGGGMFNSDGSSPTVTDCTFIGNSAAVGGGMLNYFNSNPTVTYCTFSGNAASNDAGGMYNFNNSPMVINCIFSGNSADDVGGGMSNVTGSSPTVINCTLSGNSAMNGGGGMYNFNNSFMATNCIFWGDEPDEIYNSSSTATVTYCDVQGGYGGTGNIDADPCFVDDSNPDPNLCNLRLKPDSPCIDAGDNNSVPADTSDLDGDEDYNEPIPFDLNRFPRFIDDLCMVDTGNPGTLGPTIVDMGAYEFLPADIDSSGAVDLVDLARLALRWAETGCGRCGGANMTCEGNVDWNDLGVLTDWWLAGTEPEL